MSQRSRQLRRALVRGLALLSCLAAVTFPTFAAGSLLPTHAALLRQSIAARDAGAVYLDSDQQVHDAVRNGQLVTLRANDDYFIHPDVRFSAARADVKLFVERLSHQMHASCGDRLVVTSLVRPRNRQPWNSDPLSVHPTGMAVDLRIPQVTSCRRWLEKTLVDLEGDGLIEAARERVVPHYHVVVFPAYASALGKKGIDVPALDGTLLASLAGPAPVRPLLGLPALGLGSPLAAPPATVPALATSSPVVQVAQVTATAHPTVRSTTSRRTSAVTKRSSKGHATSTKRASTRRYKVRRGDTLWTIARHHGVTVAALRRSNRVASHLKPGVVLSIPAR